MSKMLTQVQQAVERVRNAQAEVLECWDRLAEDIVEHDGDHFRRAWQDLQGAEADLYAAKSLLASLSTDHPAA